MSYELEKHTLHELWDLGKEMDLRPRRSKQNMIKDISEAFQEYEKYRKDKILKYKRIRQLGNKGKEGTTYLVTSIEDGKDYAMKTFRKTKSSITLKKEYKLQKRASKMNISPKVYDYDIVSKYIVMDIMDKHLIEVMLKQKKNLLPHQQKRILEIFKNLDECEVFHGDANLANYMMKGKDIYLIDFGYAKRIDDKLKKKLGTDSPNMDLMLLGFILKLKEHKCSAASYKYLLPHVSEKNKEKYGLK